MATEKKITSRIRQKHDVAANWAKATNFIPQKGEIIIYDAEYNASGEETQAVRFKIGDGSKTVNNLPFAVIDYNDRITALEGKPGLDKVGTVTGVKMNGATKTPSSGVVDLGTVLTDQSIRSINTNNTAAQAVNASETIAGSGTINLHKIAKTGNYSDLLNKPSNATQSIAGLMSVEDKKKLDGIATGANAYVLPSADSDRLGGIKISFSNGVLTITT